MATRKPISTISYNSESFLKEKLDNLLNQHIIQTYMYIKHVGEDGDKDHIHLRLEPNKTIDVMDLIDLFKEYTPTNSKPLGIRPFRPSKEEDWILYAVHDESYLRYKYGGFEKGEKLPYNWEDIVVPEIFEHDKEIAYIRAKQTLEHTSSNLAKQLMDGVNPIDLILMGENVQNVNAIYRAMTSNDYQRLHEAYAVLESKYNILYNAVVSSGFELLHDDDGKFYIGSKFSGR